MAQGPAGTVSPTEFIPRAPRNIQETGLNLGFLVDLALKILYYEGVLSGYELAERMKLPYAGIVDQVIEFLKREKLCEVKGAGGFAEAAYQYAISDRGRLMAREALDRSHYAGPAPVPLEAYSDAVRKQSLGQVVVHPRTMRQALSHLVINEETFAKLGPAVNSGKSIFLYGPPGNGKTVIAEAIGRMIMTGTIYIPYAVEVDGQVIKVFDNVNHVVAEPLAGRSADLRWVCIRRPMIMVGGELTLESLDLVYDETNKYYEAPFQMKANGGMLLIDDFGRQQVRPRDLLNRWIVPLEKRVDFLTLHTGRKIEVPFDVLIVFATNLAPKDLVDEAFLRRIRHKIEIKNPTFDEYREIFRRVCQQKGVPYDDRGLAYLLQEYYIKPKRPLRACHPRDIVEQLCDIARYLNVPPTLSPELIDRAASAYFVEL
ncbi:MAG: AAA family ATPase [Thermoflexia bacterium]|nr:MAG: AAA family ATPase [Thermoflexia bacterium]